MELAEALKIVIQLAESTRLHRFTSDESLHEQAEKEYEAVKTIKERLNVFQEKDLR